MGASRSLKVFIRHANVGVSRLISGYDNTLGIGQVSDAGVFQTVELVALGKIQSLPHLLPLYTELIHINFFGTGNEFLSESELI